jgi:hypothetical protein
MTSSRYLFNCLLMMLLATLSFLRMAEASESFQVLVNQGRNEVSRRFLVSCSFVSHFLLSFYSQLDLSLSIKFNQAQLSVCQ